MIDLAVRRGRVVGADGIRDADVGVIDGRIAAIGTVGRARREVDADGALVLPGGVDAHVHLNSDWPFPDERRPAEGFAQGTRAAVAGGITTVCDFAYPAGDDLIASVEEVQRRAAAESCIDVGLHPVVMALRPGLRADLVELVRRGFPSFKFYTPLPDFDAHREGYVDLLSTFPDMGALAMFHCEDPTLLAAGAAVIRAERGGAVSGYGSSKPVEIEETATRAVLEIARRSGVTAYLVHVSCVEVLADVEAARRAGVHVVVETRPLYLHLTRERYDAPDSEAARYVGTPPLRGDADRAALWTGARSGTVDIVATDHVGFTVAQKHQAGDTFETVPKGMPNLETMLPMLYSEGVRTGRLSVERLVELVSTTPARILGLAPRKGSIKVGADADLCVLDPAARRTLADGDGHGLADLEVYRGFDVTGWPAVTISRGEVVFADGEVTAVPGRGRVVARSLTTAA